MAARIDDDFMTAEHGGRVIDRDRGTARTRRLMAREGWIASRLPRRLFSRGQAITALVLAERLAAGFGDDDPFVSGWREELGL